jgi:outer membrane protein insertion porin family
MGCVLTLPAFASVIKQIDIEGNHKIEAAAIRSRLQSKVDAPYSEATVQEDIRTLFAMGYFDNIEAYEDDFEGGIKVIFQVHEKPTIAKIEYKGLSAIDEDDMKDLVLVKPYQVLDIAKTNQSVEKIAAKYEEKGFYLADVRYDIVTNPKTNDVNLIFQIQENDKIQVRNINIIGAKVIAAEDLKKVMQTKEGGLLSFITGSGSYREAVFERDIAALGFYYGTMGYVRARFGKPEVSVSPDKKFINITFSVEEGQQYFVGEVDFSGELLYTRQELKDDLKLVTGEVFNTETLRRETLKYTDKYADLGYAFANVVPQPNIHDDTRRVDVTFDVDKGERVYLGKITVTGNTRSKDKVVRRELKIQEGELYSGTRKRLSRENVMRLGFFDSVEFHQSTSKQDPHIVDIDIKVKERSTGQLVIGAGYASGDIGFTAQAQLSQNNFLGNGQVASLSAQVLTGQQFYEFNLGFTEPYVGYSNWSLGGDIYQLRRNLYSNQTVPTFQETKTGFDVKLGHPVTEFTQLFFTYKLEYSYVPISSIIDISIINPQNVNGLLSSVAASLVNDHRDDRFDPRLGYYWSLSSEYAGLGGSRIFLRSRATTKLFHPIIGDFIFRANLTAANIMQVGPNDVPTNELFIQGGLFSLRGYDYLTVGPKRTISSNASFLSQGAINNNLQGTSITIGGHNEVLMQSEVEFPLLKEARIRGVIFFDAGNAFDGTFGDVSPALLANIGWGFRWFTPIGPLRFEFGYPIVNPGSPKFYFTIGPPF